MGRGGVIFVGRNGKDWSAWRWSQDIKNTLGMEVHQTGELATCQESFGWVMMRAAFGKEPATR